MVFVRADLDVDALYKSLLAFKDISLFLSTSYLSAKLTRYGFRFRLHYAMVNGRREAPIGVVLIGSSHRAGMTPNSESQIPTYLLAEHWHGKGCKNVYSTRNWELQSGLVEAHQLFDTGAFLQLLQ
jgi:hypothetical protein